MVISGRGRYAITAMMSLALHSGKKPLSLADVAKLEGISLSYLEQIFAQLRRRGLVVGTRGRQGGYSLSRSPQQISIGEILRAVHEDGADEASATSAGITMQRRQMGSLRSWEALNERIFHMLDDIDLAQSILLDPLGLAARGKSTPRRASMGSQ